jgi:hypothetical protein
MGQERTNFEVTNENKRLAGSSEKIDRLANEAVIKSASGMKKRMPRILWVQKQKCNQQQQMTSQRIKAQDIGMQVRSLSQCPKEGRTPAPPGIQLIKTLI